MKLRYASIKRLIKESISEQYCTFEGKVYVNLYHRVDMLHVGIEALLLPNEETINTWKKNLAEREEAAKDEDMWGQRQAVEEARSKLTHIGKVGKVVSLFCIMGKDFATEVEFPGDVTVRTNNRSIWTELESSQPDWRPDETLPEDYYAL